MLTHLNKTPSNPDRVVVMGANSFVGGKIIANLQARGINVLGLGRQDVDLLSEGGADKLAEILRTEDTFVSVSAIAPVKNPAMLRENITLIETLADALKKQPVAHVLNIGSDAIFADSMGLLAEDSCAAPGALHGIMHVTRELMLSEAAGNAPFATLRPTLIYGLEDPHNGYGPNQFRRLAQEGQEIKLFGEGEERRDHVYVEDVAELAARIIVNRSEGSLNAATGTVISFRECAEAIADMFTDKVSVTGRPRSGPMPHNGYRAFDPAATKAAFPDFSYVQPLDGFALVHKQLVANKDA